MGSPNSTLSYNSPEIPPPNLVPLKDKGKAEGNTKIPGKNIIAPSSLNHCLFKFTYIWLDNGLSFWSKPVAITNESVFAWVWNGVSWNYINIYLYLINTFLCY